MAYRYPVGYSDHTLGVTAPIMSIAKGACIIEKHFTLDKGMEGWDHKISADPEELRQICAACRVGYKMLGTTQIVVSEDEERRGAFQRSIVAARKIHAGERVTLEDLDYKRPGTGIAPKNYETVVGRVASRDIEYDHIITLEDF